MARTGKLLIGVVVAAAIGYVGASPYLAVNAMRDAAIAGDAAGVSEHVDFPAVKDSLKANMSAAAMKAAGESNEENPLAGAGAMLAMALVGPMIDAVLTPEGLTMLMRQGKLVQDQAPRDEAQASTGDKVQEIDADMRYRDFSTFVVTLKYPESQDRPMGLVFKRHGIVSWKLTSLDLPL